MSASSLNDHKTARTDGRERGWHWTLLAAVAALTVGIRCVGLLARCVWFDESMSWRTVILPWPEMIESVRLDAHAPLYFVVLKGWIDVWGDSLAALRILNVVLAVATLPVIALFFRGWLSPSPPDSHVCEARGTIEMTLSRRSNLGATGIAMVLFAVSPYQIRVASDMRMYPMMALLSLLSSWLLFRAVDCPERIVRWIGFAAVALLILYTHYFGLFFVTTQFLFLAGWVCVPLVRSESGIGVTPVKEDGRNEMPGVDRKTDRMPLPQSWRRANSRAVAGILIAAVVVSLGWLVWLPTFLDQRQRVHGGWWKGPLSGQDLIDVAVDWIASTRAVGTAEGIVATVFVVLTVVILIRLLSIGGVTGFYLAWMILIPTLMLVCYSGLKTNLMVSRYFAPVQILWLMGLAITIASIPRSVTRYVVRDLVVYLSLAAHAIYLYDEDVWQRGGIREAVAGVERELRPNELVIVDSSLIYFPASFYARNRLRWRMMSGVNGLTFSTGLPVTQESDYVHWYDLRDARNEGLWLVSSRHHKDFAPGAEWEVADRQYFRGTQPFQESVEVTYLKRAILPPISTPET